MNHLIKLAIVGAGAWYIYSTWFTLPKTNVNGVVDRSDQKTGFPETDGEETYQPSAESNAGQTPDYTTQALP